MKRDVCIVGGGMGGICAAIMLSEAGKKVTILERQDRIGKKLLLTGSGKCNISNVSMDASHYISDKPGMVSGLIERFGREEVRSYLGGLGIELCEKNGYLYPVTRQARTVLDVLRFKLEENEVETLTDVYITKAEKRDGVFELSSRDGRTFTAHKCIFACGGLAGIYGEEKENGYEALKQAGHKIIKTYPALVQLLTVEELKAVAGIRCDVNVSLIKNGKLIAKEQGELQITEKAMSGIAVFQLSRYMEHAGGAALKIDFLPYVTDDSMVKERFGRFHERELERFFAGWLDKKLAIYLIKRAGLKPSMKAADLGEETVAELIHEIKNEVFELKGSNGYKNAQISGGGIALSEVNEYMESCKIPGLYIIGEMLNVCGECGGYNLHFAMASAYAATQGILCTE